MTPMAPLHRTLSNRLLKLPPFQPSWPRAAWFSAAADGGTTAPAPSSSAVAAPPPPPYESSPPIDAGSSIRKPISLWPGMYFSPVTNALWEARSKMFEEVGGAGASGKAAPLPTSELVPWSPARSRTSIFYKFSSDYVLWEQYRNPWNEIRVGKLVEDLDALTGTICYKADVRNFLCLKYCVLYTKLDNPDEPMINVKVVAHVMQPGLRSSEVSNEFYFTLTIRPEALNDGLGIRKAHPWKKRCGMSLNVWMLRLVRLHPEDTSPVPEADSNASSQVE